MRYALIEIIGGIVMGAGITFAGACPGTTLAQLGVGLQSARYVLGGGLLGAACFGYFHGYMNQKTRGNH